MNYQIFLILISYILFTFNTYLQSSENNKVKVMFSINSYDPINPIKPIKIERRFEMSNPTHVYDVKNLVLLKKAPLCV